MEEKLTAENRTSLLANGQVVYSAYSLLDMATNAYYASQGKSFWIDEKKQTFREFVHSLTVNVPSSNSSSSNSSHQAKIVKAFTIGESNLRCTLELIQNLDGSWKIQILSEGLKTTPKSSNIYPLKKLHQYTPEDFIAFTQNYPLTLQQNKAGKPSLSTTFHADNQEVTLGGEGKVELYQIHLVNLEKMLAHINSNNPNSNMLVDMTTGSGKSFTQALWFFVLYLSHIPALFAVPRKDLVAQLQKDFIRLLPKAIVDNVSTAEQGALTTLWGITTHENVLHTSWNTRDEKCWLCFDEEHEASEKELFKKRIYELEQKSPMLFLSATPNENTYKLCSSGAIISFSRREKIASKVAQPTINYTIRAFDKTKKIVEESTDLFNRLQLMLMGGEAPSGAVHAYTDACETTINFAEKHQASYKNPEENKTDPLRVVRWNLQCPISEKALVHADSADMFVNFYRLSHEFSAVYRRGRVIERSSFLKEQFSTMRNIDMNAYNTDKFAKLGIRKDAFFNYIKNDVYIKNSLTLPEDAWKQLTSPIDFATHAEYLRHRVLHGLIETTLQYLTGDETKQLDYERFNDLPQLVEKVKTCINASSKNSNNIEAYLMGAKIPLSIAKQISPLVSTIIRDIENSEMTEHIIDNWGLDLKLHTHFFADSSTGNAKTKSYQFSEKHSTIFLASGLDKTIHAIESNRPFFRFRDTHYNEQSPEVKTNPELRELLAHAKSANSFSARSANISVLQPQYLEAEYTPEAVDALYEKGLVGAYVTNMRTSGFNSPTTHHNVILIDSAEDKLNDPDQSNQAAGRLRCLNPHRSSSLFLSTNKGVIPSLPPDVLDSENFYRIFFQAKKNYHQEIVKTMGEAITKAIETYVCGAVAIPSGGGVQFEELEKKCEAIIFEYFEKLHQQCNHDFDKTKQEFASILGDTYKALYRHCENFQNVHRRLDPLARAFIVVINFIGGLWYALRTAAFYVSFVFKDLSLKVEEKNAKNVPVAKTHILPWIKSNSKIDLAQNFKDWQAIDDGHLQKTFTDFLNNQVFSDQAVTKNISVCVAQLAAEWELNLPESQDPRLFEQEWTTKLTKKLQGDDLNLALERLKTWIAANTGINTVKEFEAWKKIEKNREKTLNEFVKQEIFGGTEVSCRFAVEDFNSERSKAMQNYAGDIYYTTILSPFITSAALTEKLTEMLEAQNPINLDRERTYRYIIRNYNYADLTSTGYRLSFFMQSIADEMRPLGLSIFDDYTASPSNGNNIPDEMLRFISRYFEIPNTSSSMAAIIDDLPDVHLLNLLTVLYPQEGEQADSNSSRSKKAPSHQQLLKELREFAKDCKRLPAEVFFKKHFVEKKACYPTLFFSIFAEIYNSVCYYHKINSPAIPKLHKTPRLKPQTWGSSQKEVQGHEIWQNDPYISKIERGRDAEPQLMQLYRDTWGISAVLDTTPFLNAVEGVKSSVTSSTMKNIAENFIAPMQGYFSGSFFAPISRFIKSQQNITTEGRSLFNLASTLGKKFEAGETLTKAEILSPDTKYFSAVDKLRAGLNGS